ncbi:hypothetical protein BCR42DRAFT_449684 [Absidia repens]|uniref:Uncharacterized protein n=1 Tax=Absidia repens TaxID=90262 RepID=A0A1X2IMN4_9FUNG|nr:hypothetical protein BCR42DRAFT_449684 [Absidia repens]
MQHHVLSTVKICFKHTKLSSSVLSALAQSLCFVALGFRASQLIDYHLTPTQANILITKLKQHENCRSLVLLQFSDRYTFICHRQRLRTHYLEYINGFTGYYVDVQGTIPCKMNGAPEDMNRFMMQELGPYLESQASNDNDALMVPTLPCFMVCLTGWLLEYPVIYVCHQVDEIMDEWEPRLNCLGNHPLEWIKLQINCQQQQHPLLSFTYPTQLFSDKKEQKELLEQVQMKFCQRVANPCASSPAMELIVTQETVSLDRVAL